MTYAVVVDGLVVNVVLWDGESEFDAPGQLVQIPDDTPAGVGWSFDGSTWTSPPQPDDDGEADS